jgi:hypothetical protein
MCVRVMLANATIAIIISAITVINPSNTSAASTKTIAQQGRPAQADEFTPFNLEDCPIDRKCGEPCRTQPDKQCTVTHMCSHDVTCP